MSIHLGGHEPIKHGIQESIENENATRCLFIVGLSPHCTEKILKDDIQKQSAEITVVYELIEHGEFSSDDYTMSLHWMAIKFGSIGTALGARKVLSEIPFYRGCHYHFEMDPCCSDIGELGCRWEFLLKQAMNIPAASIGHVGVNIKMAFLRFQQWKRHQILKTHMDGIKNSLIEGHKGGEEE